MRTLWPAILAVVVAAVIPAPALALDAPHDGSFTDGNCDHCHSLYNPNGSGQSDYSPGCVSCHANSTNSKRGFPWLTDSQAVPGKSGTQHSWSGFAANDDFGTRTPDAYDVSKKLVDGRLQCATCHDPHRAGVDRAAGQVMTSIPLGTATAMTGGTAGGTAQLTLVSVGTVAKGYRLKIQTVTAGGGTFVISHDASLATPSWYNWSGSAWVIGTVGGPGKPYANDTAVPLDDPAVAVKWTAGAVAGNWWDFYVTSPMLRSNNASDAFCTMCHASYVMTHTVVDNLHPYYQVDGVRRFSHPVGQGLNANGKNTDVAEILDATGVRQSVGDGNASNDLKLDGGVVRCTTCHAVHNADSNSLSVDRR
jgi:hypothetical protein